MKARQWLSRVMAWMAVALCLFLLYVVAEVLASLFDAVGYPIRDHIINVIFLIVGFVAGVGAAYTRTPFEPERPS